MNKKHQLSRRHLLRGAASGVGVALALPLLEAMVGPNGDALADGQPLPLRFMTWFFGNGVRLEHFVPVDEGPDYTLSAELAPLAPFKNYVSVLTGFNNHCHESNKITHHEGMVIFSGHNNRDIGEGEGYFSNAGGPTIDQVIAQLPHIGDDTPFRSIQLGVSSRKSLEDNGTTMHYLSHSGYGQPIAPERNPLIMWKALFQSFVPPDDPQRALRLSVLDLVRENAARLNKRLGSVDRMRLEHHLNGISELEKRIKALPPLCTIPEAPFWDGQTVPKTNEAHSLSGPLQSLVSREYLKEKNQLINQLIATAFACDLTRVASLLFSYGAGGAIYEDIGQSKSFHQLTHSEDKAVQDKEVHEGIVYTMECFADLLQALQEAPAGVDGNLLDRTAIFCSSDCSEGWSHSVDKQPMIVAGGGGGALVHPGIHYASKSGENPSDVLLSLLRVYDPGATEVGSEEPGSKTPFEPILAS